jgi:DNA-binding IclR family transcriptional regulator
MNNRRGDSAGSATQVQSVDRALSILEFLAGRGSAGVTEIAKNLDVHKSTAFRLVMALENRELVEQVEERGKYRLGFGLVRLAGATSAQLDLTKQGRPICLRLAADFDETVNIAVLDSGAATNITQEHGGNVIGTRNWVGQRTPLHATSSGKVLLAATSGELRDQLMAGPFERFTPATITDLDRLREELGVVERRGWASCAEELEVGLNSVGAPLRGVDGEVIGAVSVAGPSYRFRPEQFPAVAERLLAGAGEISMRMGCFAEDLN